MFWGATLATAKPKQNPISESAYKETVDFVKFFEVQEETAATPPASSQPPASSGSATTE